MPSYCSSPALQGSVLAAQLRSCCFSTLRDFYLARTITAPTAEEIAVGAAVDNLTIALYYIYVTVSLFVLLDMNRPGRAC